MTGILTALLGNAVQATQGPPPGGVPLPDFDFNYTAPTTNTLALTAITRASSATVQGTNGYLSSVGNNVPRLDFRFSSASSPIPLGLMIEPASNNLLHNSDRLDTAASWALASGTLTAAAATGALGQQNMVQITTGGTFSEIHQSIGAVTTGTVYGLSCFVRRGVGDTFGVAQFTELGSGWGAGVFDLANQITGTSFNQDWSVQSVNITPVGDGQLLRCSVVATPLSNKTSNISAYLQLINPANGTWQATAGSTWFVSDIQVESPLPSTGITSYIPNTGTSTVTRAAETCALTLGVIAQQLRATGNVATFIATVALPSAIANGSSVVITGATPSGYNGTVTIGNVNRTQNSFTYTVAGPLVQATGTVIAALASQSLDILIEDVTGKNWSTAVAVTSGAYALVPRSGQTHVGRLRAWAAGLLTQAQRDQFLSTTPPGTDAGAPPLSGYTLAAYWDFGSGKSDSLATSNVIDTTTLLQQFYPYNGFAYTTPVDTHTYDIAVDHLDLGIYNNGGTVVTGEFVSHFVGTFGYYEARCQIDGTTNSFVRVLVLECNVVDGIAGTNGGNTSDSQIAIEFFCGFNGGTNQIVALTVYHRAVWGSFYFTCPFDPTAAFHVYAFNWTPQGVQLYIDGSPQGPLLAFTYSSAVFPNAPPAIEIGAFSSWITPLVPANNTGLFNKWDYIRFWQAPPSTGGGGPPPGGGTAAQAGTVPTATGTNWTTSGIGATGHDKSTFGWTQTFLDDFAGVPELDPTRGNTTQLYYDRTKWTSGFIPVAYGVDSGNDGSRFLAGNGEQQIYCDKDFGGPGPGFVGVGPIPPAQRINPFFIANSIMEIESGFVPVALQPGYLIGGTRVFYSGCLNSATKFSQKYGLFEARVKFPAGALGAWPAFWFLSQPTSLATNVWPPEIDCLEQFPKLHPTQTHWGEISQTGSLNNGNWANLPSGTNSDYHTYSMFYTSSLITWAVDGIQIGQTPTPPDMNVPFYILLNIAVGGNWYQQESRNASLQTLVDQYNADTTQMPYRTQWDYVRAYQVGAQIPATISNPTSNLSFSQALTQLGMGAYKRYIFGTATTPTVPSLKVANTTDLGTYFNPRDSYNSDHHGNDGEWQRYTTTFGDATAYVFTTTSLKLQAYIPGGGGLFDGGITSGMLALKENFAPGSNPTGNVVLAFELVAKQPPNNPGNWPAFWAYQLNGSSGGPNEIDCIETPVSQNGVWSTTHWVDGTGITPSSLTSDLFDGPGWDGFKIPLTFDLAGGFHSYAWIWTKTQLWIYLDGVPMRGFNYNYTASLGIELLAQYKVGANNWGQPGMYPTNAGTFPMAFEIQQWNIWTSQTGIAPAPGVDPNAIVVSPAGSDSNSGTLASPFLTLAKAQATAQGATDKTIYLRAGTYTLAQTLNLTATDNGETWSYYPPDGYNTAVVDGAFGVAALVQITAASNITINGIAFKRATAFGIRTPDIAGLCSGLTIENCDMGFFNFPGGGALQSAAIYLNNTLGTLVQNNYIHDCQATGIAVSAFNTGDKYTSAVIKNNVLLRTCLGLSDDGAIYLNARNTGTGAGSPSITNNYVKDFGAPGRDATVGIYLDDTTSNATVSGNIIGPTGATSSSSHGQLAYNNNGGTLNVFSGNIVDVGASSFEIAGLWFNSSTNDNYTGNVIIFGFAGARNTNYASLGAGDTFVQSGGSGYTITNNMYHNYAGGSEITAGNVTSDANPTHADPLLSSYTYTLAGGSPAFNAPVNFPAIIGGWGPPGFIIPQSGIAPSCPH